MNDNTPGKDAARPSDVRCSDAEREAVIAQLQTAASEGRLTLGEFGERADAVYAARTRGELVPLTADLPAPSGGGSVPTGATMATSSEEPRRYNAIMGDRSERLHGTLPAELRILCVIGDMKLDLRDVVLNQGEINVTGHIFMGEVRLVVPDGVRVESAGTNILAEGKTRQAAAGHGPLVRVKVVNVMGEMRVVDAAHQDRPRGFKRWWHGH